MTMIKLIDNGYQINSLKLDDLLETFILDSVEEAVREKYYSESDTDIELLEEEIIRQMRLTIEEYLGK